MALRERPICAAVDGLAFSSAATRPSGNISTFPSETLKCRPPPCPAMSRKPTSDVALQPSPRRIHLPADAWQRPQSPAHRPERGEQRRSNRHEPPWRFPAAPRARRHPGQGFPGACSHRKHAQPSRACSALWQPHRVPARYRIRRPAGAWRPVRFPARRRFTRETRAVARPGFRGTPTPVELDLLEKPTRPADSPRVDPGGHLEQFVVTLLPRVAGKGRRLAGPALALGTRSVDDHDTAQARRDWWAEPDGFSSDAHR